MISDRPHAAKTSAKLLLRKLWKRRQDYFSGNPSTSEFLKQAPELIVREILGLELIFTELKSTNPLLRLAGFVDRRTRQIVVNTLAKLEWQRFTLAHEIGHWMLHPGEVYFRERPLDGTTLTDAQRPIVEVEADIFAAELLMPPKAVWECFRACFGSPIEGHIVDQELAFSLSRGLGFNINPTALTMQSPLERAIFVARTSVFRTHHFKPLMNQFHVSATAMAVQLVDLGLVT